MQIFKLILFIIIAFLVISVIIGYSISEKGYDGPKTANFNGKKFINPNGVPGNGLRSVFKYFFTRKPEPWKRNYETFVRSEAIPSVDSSEVQITFVNHSTFLIQYQGMNILTDPVWSKRCSPFQFAGPGRFRPPGVRFEDLPKIDLVIISHNHYDHLDKNTINDLVKKHDPAFVCPLGVEHVLQKWGASEVRPMDWWQTTDIGSLVIKSVPANHFTSRGTFDRDQTLWSGFILTHSGHKIYFAGDTGYSEVFKEIGKREGSIDIALIPIGAYLPRWFMSPIHVSPKESVLIHRDVNAKQSIGMHFGTFALADDGPDRPIIDLDIVRKENSIPEEEFIVPEEGMNYRYGLK